MKLTPLLRHSLRGVTGRRDAFTLTEILTAMAVFSLVMVGAFYSHLFGLRMFNVTATKLSASENSRVVLNRVVDEVRSGKLVYVGNGSSASFTATPTDTPQEGNALQVYPTIDTNVFVRFFLDPSTQTLRRLSTNGSMEVIASYVTNQVVFCAEDYLGNTLTNNQNNRTIKLTLEFYQWEFPVAQVAPGAYYDYCRLQTRITRRAID
jgi:prepilin-type N-terminal cleavage/methylation domain-containing protein